MTPDVVVDVGNSRMKWGWCLGGNIARVEAFADDVATWVRAVGNRKNLAWAVASVNPQLCERFFAWANHRGDRVTLIQNDVDLPIRLEVEAPESVGIDRLLGAVAANVRRRANTPAITVDVGTAVTINSIDDAGNFRGGAILPGYRLMGLALHEHTAKLPIIPADDIAKIARFPGQNTRAAIMCGIRAAVAGAVEHVVDRLGNLESCDYFVTGGDALLLLHDVDRIPFVHVPTLVLEGIQISAEALP